MHRRDRSISTGHDQQQQGRYRLVVRSAATGPSYEARPLAFLYPVDANPWTGPLAVFALSPGQELPRIQPGAVVDVDGSLETGPMPQIDADGVIIRPRRRLSRRWFGGVPGFAERGDVLADPRVVGWQPSWRYAQSPSRLDVPAWRRRLRAGRVLGWVSLLILLSFAAWTILAVIDDDVVFPSSTLLWWPLWAVGALQGWRTVNRARRALDAAERARSGPGRPMRLLLWWSAGHGRGPLAVASLAEPDDLQAATPVTHVPVVNVPASFDPPPGTLVEVFGDHRGGAAPVIRCGDVTMWPAGPARPTRDDGPDDGP